MYVWYNRININYNKTIIVICITIFNFLMYLHIQNGNETKIPCSTEGATSAFLRYLAIRLTASSKAYWCRMVVFVNV